mgnify:CR=1 FL=1
MKKIEKELTEFFEKESESLRLPAEDEIKAIPAKILAEAGAKVANCCRHCKCCGVLDSSHDDTCF